MITSTVGEQKKRMIPLTFNMPVVGGLNIEIIGYMLPTGVFVLKTATYNGYDLKAILHTTGTENIQAAACNNISSNDQFQAFQIQRYGDTMEYADYNKEDVRFRLRVEDWLTNGSAPTS